MRRTLPTRLGAFSLALVLFVATALVGAMDIPSGLTAVVGTALAAIAAAYLAGSAAPLRLLVTGDGERAAWSPLRAHRMTIARQAEPNAPGQPRRPRAPGQSLIAA